MDLSLKEQPLRGPGGNLGGRTGSVIYAGGTLHPYLRHGPFIIQNYPSFLYMDIPANPAQPCTSDLLYTISCLLADIDLVVERLDDNFHHTDLSKLVDMVDDLVVAKDLLLDADPDSPPDLDFLDDQCQEEEPSQNQNGEEENF